MPGKSKISRKAERGFHVSILEVEGGHHAGGVLPRCDQCGIHMPAARTFKHRKTENCNKVTERRIQRSDLEMSARCGEMEFSL